MICVLLSRSTWSSKSLVPHKSSYQIQGILSQTFLYQYLLPDKKSHLPKLVFFGCKHSGRIKNDLVDPEKVQATLADETLNKDCELKKALEMVTLLEAQLKEMNPNLDSISEYFPLTIC